ncbi:hypothetical protein [Curtobacterium sp. MCPF17_052]|uniref:hypothetical protein n=1 Tax=Curtobacterium sp. MCPF17_052 TaxID=2175655 RepID=UPI0024DF3288|nr:hypothetical protein [Curtobacterium sp. MCPF17_052]WIB11616.1 hypothetical protein DEJ36_11720 [Curtobacterium sp. MCPF17_052]
MRGFVNAMVIALRARPEFLNGPTVFVVLIGSPTLLAALYLAVASASGTSSIEPPDAVAAGLAVAGVMSTMSSSSLLSADQVHATLPFIVIAPASRALVWTARVFVVTSIGVVQGIVSVVASFAVTRNAPLDRPGPPGLRAHRPRRRRLGRPRPVDRRAGARAPRQHAGPEHR